MKPTIVLPTVLSALCLSPLVRAGSYSINQTNIGKDFLTNFEWEDITDPTKGRVSVILRLMPKHRN